MSQTSSHPLVHTHTHNTRWHAVFPTHMQVVLPFNHTSPHTYQVMCYTYSPVHTLSSIRWCALFPFDCCARCAIIGFMWWGSISLVLVLVLQQSPLLVLGRTRRLRSHVTYARRLRFFDACYNHQWFQYLLRKPPSHPMLFHALQVQSCIVNSWARSQRITL